MAFLKCKREQLPVVLSPRNGSSSNLIFCFLTTSFVACPRVAKVSVLCQAASLMVTVKTEQFKREIAARKKAGGGGKGNAEHGAKEKDGLKQD